MVCMYLLCSHRTSRSQKFCCHNLQISGCTKTCWNTRVSKLMSWQYRRLLVFALCCQGNYKCISIVVFQVVLGGSFPKKFFFFLAVYWEGVMIVLFQTGWSDQSLFYAYFLSSCNVLIFFRLLISVTKKNFLHFHLHFLPVS